VLGAVLGVDDEAPAPLASPELGEVLGLMGEFVVVDVIARVAEAPIPLLQPQPQNAEASTRAKSMRNDDF
jgi:hypothetical protein